MTKPFKCCFCKKHCFQISKLKKTRLNPHVQQSNQNCLIKKFHNFAQKHHMISLHTEISESLSMNSLFQADIDRQTSARCQCDGERGKIEKFQWSGMSFCRGSVNCHGSDGQMYHFCESSRSGEIFLDQYRGGGWGSLFPVINSSESAYFVA